MESAMNRRNFLTSTASFSAAVSSGWVVPSWLAHAQSDAETAWRIFEVTARVELLKPTGTTRIWLPTPLTVDTMYQKNLGHSVKLEEGGLLKAADQVRDANWGLGIVTAEFQPGSKPGMTLTSRFATRNYSVDPFSGRGMMASMEEQKRFLKPSELLPTDGIVKSTSESIIKGLKSDTDKARAIYDWIVENTYRDPKVRGCGVGETVIDRVASDRHRRDCGVDHERAAEADICVIRIAAGESYDNRVCAGVGRWRRRTVVAERERAVDGRDSIVGVGDRRRDVGHSIIGERPATEHHYRREGACAGDRQCAAAHGTGIMRLVAREAGYHRIDARIRGRRR